jgi:hypothetical protein
MGGWRYDQPMGFLKWEGFSTRDGFITLDEIDMRRFIDAQAPKPRALYGTYRRIVSFESESSIRYIAIFEALKPDRWWVFLGFYKIRAIYFLYGGARSEYEMQRNKKLIASCRHEKASDFLEKCKIISPEILHLASCYVIVTGSRLPLFFFQRVPCAILCQQK